MKKIKLKGMLKWTACVFAVAIGAGVTFFAMNSMKNTYATTTIQPDGTYDLTEENYEINLSGYEKPNRTITRGPNETGVTIIYDDGHWTYMDEYTGSIDDKNELPIEAKKISTERAHRICEICIAPGYEAILRDGIEEGYYTVDGEQEKTQKHTTRILGPINIKGDSFRSIIISAVGGGKEFKTEWEKGSDEYDIEIIRKANSDDTFDLWARVKKDDESFDVNLYELAYWMEIPYSTYLDYCLHKNIYGNNKYGMVEAAWSTLEDIFKKFEENYKDEDNADDFEEYYDKEDMYKKYVKLSDYNNRDYLSRVTGELLVEDDTDDKREDVKIYNLKEIQVKKVSQKEGVYLMKGLYNVLSEENRYSKRDGDGKSEGIFEYLSPAIDETTKEDKIEKTRNTLQTNGHVNSIVVVGNYEVKIQRENSTWTGSDTEYILIRGAKGKVTCITNFWENEDDGGWENEISKIQIMPRVTEKDGTNDGWDRAFCYMKENGEVDKTMEKISRYATFVKRYDMEKRPEKRSVTAYTEADFKGQYLQFYMGEFNNYGNDKEIETIGSLEIAPKTRVIFFNREDVEVNLNKVNYGSISEFEYNKDSSGNYDVQNAIIMDGPANIPNLKDYFSRLFLQDGELQNFGFNPKSFVIQYVENTGDGVSLFNYSNGIGTYHTEGVEKLNQKLSIKDYIPESISIRGNYFVKLYDSDDNLVKTIIGPVNNYNVLPELSEKKEMYIIKSLEDMENVTGTAKSTVLNNFDKAITDITNTDRSTGQEISYMYEYLKYKKKINKEEDIVNLEQGYQEKWRKLFNDSNMGDKLIKELTDFMAEIKSDIDKGYENGHDGEDYYGLKKVNYDFKLSPGSYLDRLAQIHKNKARIIDAQAELTKACKTWENAKMLIGKSTQRDSKSRSLEDTDGIVLYQNVNYNGGVQAAEDVWTHFSKDESIDFTNNNNKYLEIEPDNINSIRIVGSLAGKYEMEVECDVSGTSYTKTTRYNVPDITSFLGVSPESKVKLKKITLKEVEDKEFEMLLDTSKKSGEAVSITNYKTIKTTENKRTKKEASSKYGLDNRQDEMITKKVYIASLEDIIKEIENKISTDSTAKEFARLDYVYKYDLEDSQISDLVGVKVTRNVGTISTDDIKKGNGTETKIETYANIITPEKKDISREVEFKLNLLSAPDVLKEKDDNSSDIILSDEFSYTKGAREVVITDHSYLDKVDGASQKFLEKHIEMVDDDKYNIEKGDNGEILTAILNNGTEHKEGIVKFSVACTDKSGKANAKIELLKNTYNDTANKKEYKFELGNDTGVTLEGKSVKLNENLSGDFILPKDGGQIVANILLNISTKDGDGEWRSLANNLEYIIPLYLPETNSISKVTLVEDSVLSRTYRDMMEVPAMLVKEVKENQETADQTLTEQTKIELATENDADRILYVPVCYEEGDSYKTSFLLEQLGMKATVEDGVLKVYY